MAKRPLYRHLAAIVAARLTCIERENAGLVETHTNKANTLVDEYLPNGSGFDLGTMIDLDRSTGNKLVLLTSFHHMNDAGYYVGWTDHEVIVSPDLAFGFALRVTGSNRAGVKDYMCELFQAALSEEIEE